MYVKPAIFHLFFFFPSLAMHENLFFFFFSSESTDFVGSFHTLLTFHFQNALFLVVISLVYGRENAGEVR